VGFELSHGRLGETMTSCLSNKLLKKNDLHVCGLKIN
jgi:hypothetical protein